MATPNASEGIRCASVHTDPLAYFLTFRTYGTWLPGDDRGSTQRTPGADGHKRRPASDSLASYARAKQAGSTFVLDAQMRGVAHESFVRTCQLAGWGVLAINVRSNHVHFVVQSGRAPERTMSSLKAWATRALREREFIGPEQRVWARHGSTIPLFKQREVEYACWYTHEAQDGARFEMPSANPPEIG